MIGSLIVLGGSWRAGTAAARETLAVRGQMAAMVSTAASLPPAAASAGDFVQALPTAPTEAAVVLSQLQRACREAGVALVSVAVAQHAASLTDLGRVDLDLEMRGPYPGIKRVLSETLERHASSTVRTLRLRNDGASGSLQAKVVISLWSRPLMGGERTAPPSAGSR